jgi:hypothetical protein
MGVDGGAFVGNDTVGDAGVGKGWVPRGFRTAKPVRFVEKIERDGEKRSRT